MHRIRIRPAFGLPLFIRRKRAGERTEPNGPIERKWDAPPHWFR